MKRCPRYGWFLICIFDQIIEVFADVFDSSSALLVSPLFLLHFVSADLCDLPLQKTGPLFEQTVGEGEFRAG
jgi:hypothetical protein